MGGHLQCFYQGPIKRNTGDPCSEYSVSVFSSVQPLGATNLIKVEVLEEGFFTLSSCSVPAYSSLSPAEVLASSSQGVI